MKRYLFTRLNQQALSASSHPTNKIRLIVPVPGREQWLVKTSRLISSGQITGKHPMPDLSMEDYIIAIAG